MRVCIELVVLSAALVVLALAAPTANAQFRHGGMMMPNMGMPNMGMPHMMPNMMMPKMSNTMMPNMRSGSFVAPRGGYGMMPNSYAMRPNMPYSSGMMPYGMMPYSYGSSSRSPYSSVNYPSASLSTNYSSAGGTVAGLHPTTNMVSSGYVVPFKPISTTPVPFSYASGIAQNGSRP